MGLTIALPSGKSLHEKTLRLLAQAKIQVVRKHPRACNAAINGLPGITSALFTKPCMIPWLVSDGNVQIGITGMDTVYEYSFAYDPSNKIDNKDIEICAEFPYSRTTTGTTRCVIFTRNDNPVGRVEDIERGAFVATEYASETTKFLRRHGLQGVFMQKVSGDAESLVVSGKYPYGAALTETGDTLRINGLKIIGEVFESSTVLIAKKSLLSDASIREYVDFLAKILMGALAARGKTYLLMHAPADRALQIEAALPSLKSPTMQALADPAFVSIATVVSDSEINELIFKLTKLGAEGFVTLPPSTVM